LDTASDSATFCRTRKAALFQNRQKILKPRRVHLEACSALGMSTFDARMIIS
jgi:hypothetical protein